MFDKLKAPFPVDKVSWRIGPTNKDKTSGIPLAYIDARDVMDRLDEAVGPENWQDTYSHVKPCICSIGIKIDGEWIWKTNGAGETDIEADKGAISDAFKRAAVLWGVGRYLYDVKAPWVQIEPYGRSHRIKQSEMSKLAACLQIPAKQEPPIASTPKTRPTENERVNAQQEKLRETARSIRAALLAAQTGEDAIHIWNDSFDEIETLPPHWVESLMEMRDRFKTVAA